VICLHPSPNITVGLPVIPFNNKKLCPEVTVSVSKLELWELLKYSRNADVNRFVELTVLDGGKIVSEVTDSPVSVSHSTLARMDYQGLTGPCDPWYDSSETSGGISGNVGISGVEAGVSINENGEAAISASGGLQAGKVDFGSIGIESTTTNDGVDEYSLGIKSSVTESGIAGGLNVKNPETKWVLASSVTIRQYSSYQNFGVRRLGPDYYYLGQITTTFYPSALYFQLNQNWEITIVGQLPPLVP
jgi:hypothetical protein